MIVTMQQFWAFKTDHSDNSTPNYVSSITVPDDEISAYVKRITTRAHAVTIGNCVYDLTDAQRVDLVTVLEFPEGLL